MEPLQLNNQNNVSASIPSTKLPLRDAFAYAALEIFFGVGIYIINAITIVNDKTNTGGVGALFGGILVIVEIPIVAVVISALVFLFIRRQPQLKIAAIFFAVLQLVGLYYVRKSLLGQ